MQAIAIPQMEILHVEEVAAGQFVNQAGKAIPDLESFCRVQLVARPRPDAHIGIEVWLPIDNWNGLLLGTGNAGFGGHVIPSDLIQGVRGGYATASTDLGTTEKVDSAFSGSTGILEDWATGSVHSMTVAAQTLVNAFYGHPAKHRIFTGCSSGGGEGIAEAERYPEDYDGIVAGSPANDRVDLHISILWAWLALHQNGVPVLSQADFDRLSGASAAACPSVHGVILDPPTCKFDPNVLACKQGQDTSTCLSDVQLAAVHKMYSGPVTSNGRQIYPGVARGSESQWNWFTRKPAKDDLHVPYDELFALGLGDRWTSPRNYKFDQDTPIMESKLSPIVDTASGNLDAFKAHGGKMIVVHGWNDPVLSPFGATRYFDRIHSRYGTASDAFVRLYMVPGRAHCGGGPGPARYDWEGNILNWVELNKAPDSIEFTHGGKLKEALVCPYPKKAVYKGSGPQDEAASYSCGMQKN